MTLVERSAQYLNATPADIPGLWNAPGYPELTTNQLIEIATTREHSNTVRIEDIIRPFIVKFPT